MPTMSRIFIFIADVFSINKIESRHHFRNREIYNDTAFVKLKRFSGKRGFVSLPALLNFMSQRESAAFFYVVNTCCYINVAGNGC